MKDAAICLFGDSFGGVKWEEDKEGNITTITFTVLNGSTLSRNTFLFISKTIDGEVMDLNQKNLADMVKDDAKLFAFVNSKDYSKKDEIDIVNKYNATHKK
jgi:hypothetical protein